MARRVSRPDGRVGRAVESLLERGAGLAEVPVWRRCRVSWWSSEDPRRRVAFVAALLVASAVVGLGAGALLGVTGGDGTSTSAATSAPSTSSAAPTSPTGSPTGRAASEIERGTTSDIGHFIGARDESDGTHMTFDRVLLLLGQQARDYAKAHHKEKPKKDGVLLVNDNGLTRDLVLAPDVKVLGAQQLAGSPTLQPVPLQTLLDMVASHGTDLLLDLAYDDLGYVARCRSTTSRPPRDHAGSSRLSSRPDPS
jgi:hypothetical protein